LPPFKKHNLIFAVFATHFALQGCFMTGFITHAKADIANEILGIFLYTLCYGYAIFSVKKFRFMLAVPGLLFLGTILSPWLNVSPVAIMVTGIFLGAWQVYLLARPDVVQVMSVPVKRYYLLTILVTFFYAVYKLFLYVN
jgi:hypothetical protein